MSDNDKLTIGAIGAGRVAQTIARLALAAGHQVILSNSRGPESLTDLVGQLGEGASAGTVEDTARADITILAVGWDQVPAALENGGDLNGRIVIDTTNQWHHHDMQAPVDLGDQTGSEYIATLMPGARVVKGFNTVFMNVVAQSADRTDGRLVIFLAGDDTEANATVAAFVDSLGLAAVVLGGLRDGGRLMQAGGPLIALHVAEIA
ncbi:putative dinucleotide-binding enzyme [Kribbella aluminosa]|uniref:Dinucleotide-binding enzyme n=1 Tax=Kribbella aluminosa TaxID=416017 RepID=A0ABS4UVM2_9ACTN|nr:NAD(P)-binding domain-containing protein [Kribbella aluminosa]MBP2355687.1 putative dinucleotide-binding enzyme [Kribbella aluminosa]